jgi:hypothetical protein
MRTLLLLLLPLFTFAQFDYVYYTGSQFVTMSDDFYIAPVQQGKIVATSDYLPRYEGDYQNIMLQAKVVDSFESESDMDAIIESNWKSDYMIRPGEIKRDALLRGQDNKYYIVRWEFNQ